MKKNRTMRAAALLLALTLMTSCFVGGTFAKYTTSDSATDTARVAKWGVVLMASGDLFGTEYNPNGVTETPNDLEDNQIGTVMTSVSSNVTDRIVAPGTENTTGLTISIGGTPEVSWEVEDAIAGTNDEIYLGVGDWGIMVEATGLNDASNVVGMYTLSGSTYTKVTAGPWVSGTDYYILQDAVKVTAPYYPIVWTVSGVSTAITETRLAAIMTAMDTNFSAMKGVPNTTINESYTLTWKWEFSVDEQSNKCDTILGHLTADSEVVVSSDSGATYAKMSSANETATPAEGTYWTDINVNFSVTVSQTN